MPRVGYATVGDYVDSFENLNPLASAQGDLKDVQRPWMLKAIVSSVPRGGTLVEIGGGQPYVADLLARLGYAVWVVDPYDGSGNGPVEFETFRSACPDVHFVRDTFTEELRDVLPTRVDCVYSISVLEHVDYTGLDEIIGGMQHCLSPSGWSIHAVDHVLRGIGADEHLARLRYMTDGVGIASDALDGALDALVQDTETYFLSAESHNRWRGTTPYAAFPMRVCVSVQFATAGHELMGARSNEHP